ncbi:MAG: rRNA maturation RNase YbeY [Spirochaetes bacterium]|nr:rRNA maturation RNase YbeY [Spirochaetota bacterium]
MNAVEVALSGVTAPRWRAGLTRFCLRALDAAGIDGWDLSVFLCSDAVIRGLNERYRGKDQATDVLSFSQAEGTRVARTGRQQLAGDLVISIETLRRNAAAGRSTGARRTDEEREMKRLVVHGILHLAGMDHGRGRGRAMRDRERKLVAALAGEDIAKVGGGGP